MNYIYRFYNTETNRTYIGSTSNVEFRIKHHLEDLQNNKHINMLLQEDFNKGVTFNYEVLEETELSDNALLKLEKHIINLIPPESLYNIDLFVTNRVTKKNGRNRYVKVKSLTKLITTKKYFTDNDLKNITMIYKIPYRNVVSCLNKLVNSGHVEKKTFYYKTIKK